MKSPYLYLDSSALVKLVQTETESGALRRYLAPMDSGLLRAATSELSRVEVFRAVGEQPPARQSAQMLFEAIDQMQITRAILDDAAMLPPTILRSLDAIHLATAMLIPQLQAIVTYDERMKSAAREVLEVPVVAPQ